MSRSLKKGPFIDAKLFAKIEVMNAARDKKVVKTWARRSMIPPEFVGFTISVHNGNKFIPVYISENMVGHKLGEFSPTRTFRKHGAAGKEVDKKGGKKFETTTSAPGAAGAPGAAPAAAPAKTK